MAITAGQRSFDDLGIPLAEVTFCVVDVETDGGNREQGSLTEIGAVTVRGGEELGRFQTLIDPGTPIPRHITALTGISSATVAGAPPARLVIPAFRSFVGDAVVVGHNVRFDIGFLDLEARRCGSAPFTNRRVDTLALARRLLRGDVPDHRLATLAACLGLAHRPSHRALDDVLATVDLLHALLERAAAWGVLGLDDLVALPTLAGHPQAAKLALTGDLPHRPGVYRFEDRNGRILYVGKATDLRTRVRSYFSGDRRPKIPELLRQTHHIAHEVCAHPLEAAVRELRLIHQHQPPFNRHGRSWRSMAYLRISDEVFPRLVVTRSRPAGDGGWIGPLRSSKAARELAGAIEAAVPLRRCTARIPRARSSRAAPSDASPGTGTPCLPAQLGVASCPCSGDISAADYDTIVDTVRRGLSTEPALLVTPLRSRLDDLVARQAFEDAAVVRDHLVALTDALVRHRRLETWSTVARVVVTHVDGVVFEVRHGRLAATWSTGALPLGSLGPTTEPTLTGSLEHEAVDEVLCIAATIEAHPDEYRVEHVDGILACPLPRVERVRVPRGDDHRGPTRSRTRDEDLT